MNPKRWQKLDEFFHAALERESSARAAYVAEVCAGNDELRQELESLLAHHEQANSFIESPAYIVAAESMVDEDLAETLIGKTVGQYQILSLLGSGGMGVVYLAFDQELHRNVALKFLHDDLLSDKQRVQRFKQEARAASALNHPNILTIHQIGEVDGRQFIATEFVEGETLRELMKRERLNSTEALDIAAQIASALSAAHAADIMHRDIKPENVMVRPDGYVKVLDFGLAKLIEGPTFGSEASTLINTDQGTILGTIQYMSPEQARGRPVDARTDIWSLGVVLYEMLTEHPPFAGETKSDVIAAILEREPLPLTHYAANVPEEVQSLVNKILKKDREQRFQNAKELLGDLRPLRQRLEVEAEIRDDTTKTGVQSRFSNDRAGADTATVAPARQTSSAEYIISEIKQHKRGATVVLLIFVLTAMGLVAWLSRLARQNRSARPQSLNVTRLTTSGNIMGAAISPDGAYVAYVIAEPKCCFQQSLWLRQVGTISDTAIDPPSHVDHNRLTFSRDGHFLYYTDSHDDLFRMPAIGGAKTKVMAGVSSPISFSPDGRRFAFIRENYPKPDQNSLMFANADGSAEQLIASGSFSGGPAWSPDDRAIAGATRKSDDRGEYKEVIEVQIQGGAKRPITSQRWEDIAALSWLSDGSGLIMLGEDETSIFSPQLWEISYADGHARKITTDLNSYEDLSLTADSTMLVTEQKIHTANVWILADGDGAHARQITSGSGMYNELTWTPDERLLYDSNADGNWDIWSLDPTEGSRKQLTGNASANGIASVSPDGRYILFGSNRSGVLGLWRMEADGSNPKLLTSGHGEYDKLSCSPDGRYVVYESTRGGKTTIWKLSIDGGEPLELVDTPSSNPMISPDGRWVGFESAGSAESTLWKVSIDGGDPIQLFDKPERAPAISPDGRFVAFSYNDDPGRSDGKVAVIPLSGGPPIKTFDIPIGLNWHGVRWSPEGRSLTYVDPKGNLNVKGGVNILSQSLDGGSPKQLTDYKTDDIFSFAWSRKGQLALSRGVETSDVILLTNFR